MNLKLRSADGLQGFADGMRQVVALVKADMLDLDQLEASIANIQEAADVTRAKESARLAAPEMKLRVSAALTQSLVMQSCSGEKVTCDKLAEAVLAAITEAK